MKDVVRIVIAMLVWLALFSALYGLEGVGCATGWHHINVNGATLFQAAMTIAFFGALFILVAVLVACARRAFAPPLPSSRTSAQFSLSRLSSRGHGLCSRPWRFHIAHEA